MGRPRVTAIIWHKQFPGVRHEVAFKKIRIKFSEAYGVYREIGDILAEQPEQSLPFDEDTLLWLSEEVKIEVSRLENIINLFIDNGYINNESGLLSMDSVTESAEEINAEKERQRKKNNKNTDNGFTPGNTSGTPNGITEREKENREIKENKENSTDGSPTAENQNLFLPLNSNGNTVTATIPLKAFKDKYVCHKGKEYREDKDCKDEERTKEIARCCGNKLAYHNFLDWFFEQDDDFLRKKNWNTYAAVYKYKFFVEALEKNKEPVPWEM